MILKVCRDLGKFEWEIRENMTLDDLSAHLGYDVLLYEENEQERRRQKALAQAKKGRRGR